MGTDLLLLLKLHDNRGRGCNHPNKKDIGGGGGIASPPKKLAG